MFQLAVSYEEHFSWSFLDQHKLQRTRNEMLFLLVLAMDKILNEFMVEIYNKIHL